MPACSVSYVHPDHDTHGGSVINDNDQHDYAADLDTFDGHAHDTDEPADVTVSDLLDAFLALDGISYSDDRWTDYEDAVDSASDDVRFSYYRIRTALEDWGCLSPEERAEFDRRTT